MFGMGANPLQEYKDLITGAKEAKVVRSEKLHVNDSEVDCWVLSLEYESPGSDASTAMQSVGVPFSDLARSKTLWVDKASYLVYEDVTTTKMAMPNTSAPTNVQKTSKVESITVNDPVLA